MKEVLWCAKVWYVLSSPVLMNGLKCEGFINDNFISLQKYIYRISKEKFIFCPSKIIIIFRE